MNGQILTIGLSQNCNVFLRNNLETLALELVEIEIMTNIPWILENNSHCLVFLNTLSLPLKTRKETMKLLRESTLSPIIAIAMFDEIDEMLAVGADMCFTPETDQRIIFAHIMAMIRRFELYDSYDRGEHRTTILYRGDLVIDPWRHRVTQGEKELALRPREFGLLTYMAQNPDIVLTPSRLSKALWSDDDSYAKEVPKSVAELRRILGDNSRQPKYIKTVRGAGYRFLFHGPVSNLAETCEK